MVYIHIVPKAISGYNWDKYYVGITGMTTKHRWGSKGQNYSKQGFGYAINKYGWENIEHEIVASNLTLEEASKLEVSLIRELDANGEHGYNNNLGGRYQFHEGEDLIGKVFGNVTVLKKLDSFSYRGNENFRTNYLCECSCGNTVVLNNYQLKYTKVFLCCDDCKSKEIRKNICENYKSKNTYVIENGIIYISTQKNDIVLCDEIYFDVINRYTIFTEHSEKYNIRVKCFRPLIDNRKAITMQKLLYNYGGNVIHKNGNHLDFRKDNLYFVDNKTFISYHQLLNNINNKMYLISMKVRENFTSYSIDNKLKKDLKDICKDIKLTHHNLHDAINERNRLLHLKYINNNLIKDILNHYYLFE